MDESTAVLIQTGQALLALVAKQTVGVIDAKIKAVRSEKDIAKVRVTYDEIINELVADRAEAIRLAQSYKDEVDRIRISDEDIEHLHTTVAEVLEILKGSGADLPDAALESIKRLISADTLKTMQLLGFNYKAAIGEPLTEICSSRIRDWGQRSSRAQAQASKPNNPAKRK